MENFIKLNKSDVLRLGIKTDEGIDTGEYLEFDLEDIELPLKYQELLEKEKQNREQLKKAIVIIEKRQDVKGKILSKNEEDKIKAINDFFKKEVELYNIFLGENGVQKLLNGRKVGWTTLEEIGEIINEQIVPHLNKNMEKVTDKIKRIYGANNEKNYLNIDDDE